MNVVVVRDGGKCENAPKPDPRRRFQVLRDVVYARRGLQALNLHWTMQRSPGTGIGVWHLDAAEYGVTATAMDAGLMSYGNVDVDEKPVSHMFDEEEFAGHGGLNMTLLRLTQHVLALVEERANRVAHALRDEEAEPF